MDNDGPSTTALVTAHARAYHQIVDRPLVLDDPLALPLLGITADELTEISTHTSSPFAPAMGDRARRHFFAARSRFAEDVAHASYAAGTRQIVVLGAGLDTYAFRNPLPDLRVFEVDHPATQAWKRERLTTSGVAIPDSAFLVPVDFENDDLGGELESASFNRGQAAVFVWLGVVYYLSPEAAGATFEYVAGQRAAVDLSFDYLQPADTDEQQAEQQSRAGRLAGLGEPLHTYYTPDAINVQLRELGFTDVADRAADDVIASYADSWPHNGQNPAPVLRASRVVHARR